MKSLFLDFFVFLFSVVLSWNVVKKKQQNKQQHWNVLTLNKCVFVDAGSPEVNCLRTLQPESTTARRTPGRSAAFISLRPLLQNVPSLLSSCLQFSMYFFIPLNFLSFSFSFCSLLSCLTPCFQLHKSCRRVIFPSFFSYNSCYLFLLIFCLFKKLFSFFSFLF